METTRVRYFLDLLIDKRKPVMFVGAAGTGKSVIINDKLNSLSNDLYAVLNVPLNFYTTSGTRTNLFSCFKTHFFMITHCFLIQFLFLCQKKKNNFDKTT